MCDLFHCPLLPLADVSATLAYSSVSSVWAPQHPCCFLASTSSSVRDRSRASIFSSSACMCCMRAFSSAITSFPSSCHTVYINTKLKERGRCGSVCLRVCLGSSAPAGLSWVVLTRPSACTCGALVMFLVVLACLCGAGGVGASGGKARARPWPALAEAKLQLAGCRWPAAAGPRLGTMVAGCRCAPWPWPLRPRARPGVRGWGVVPRGLLAAAAE